jgi:hypothetical protein
VSRVNVEETKKNNSRMNVTSINGAMSMVGSDD